MQVSQCYNDQMRVFVLLEGDAGGCSVRGVFSSEELAVKRLDEILARPNSRAFRGDFYIDDFEVDE